jgi:hypothetical protein
VSDDDLGNSDRDSPVMVSSFSGNAEAQEMVKTAMKMKGRNIAVIRTAKDIVLRRC